MGFPVASGLGEISSGCGRLFILCVKWVWLENGAHIMRVICTGRAPGRKAKHERRIAAYNLTRAQPEQLVAYMPRSETVAAAIGDSHIQSVVIGTVLVGAMPAEFTNDESLPLEIHTADAIHAEILAAVGIVDEANMALVPVSPNGA